MLLMSRGDERALADRVRAGDQTAREELILANLPLVHEIVKDYKGCGLPIEDLVQEGNLGLIRASQDFDPATYVNRFSTFAAFWIRTSIQRAVLNNISLIRTSEYVGSLQARYRRALDQGWREEAADAAAIEKKNDRASLDLDDIAKRMGVSNKTFRTTQAARLARAPRSKARADAEPVELDLLAVDPGPPETNLAHREIGEMLYRALTWLDPFEAWVICERYGFRDAEQSPKWEEGPKDRPVSAAESDPDSADSRTYFPRTLVEIALECGLTVHRVRLVERTALDKLRMLMGASFAGAF
jgi:RNA polymerase primary sigma factor